MQNLDNPEYERELSKKLKFSNPELKELLDSQNSLNVEYTSENWREIIPLEAMLVAMDTEIAEYLESSPRLGKEPQDLKEGWKWWRQNLENDQQNQLVETIDVLHFLLGVLMKQYDTLDILKTNALINASELNEVLEKSFEGDVIASLMYAKSGLILDTLTNKNSLSTDLFDFYVILNLMLKGCNKVSQDLYKGYFLKNSLNLKRIQEGYIQGNYDKMSSGEEDNKSLKV